MVALLLAAIVGAQNLGIGGSSILPHLARDSSSEVVEGSAVEMADSLAMLQSKKSQLQYFKSKQQQIDEVYFKVAPLYAEQIAEMAGLNAENINDDKALVTQIIQARLDKIGVFDNVRITPSDSEAVSKGVKKILTDISFTSASSKDAVTAFLDLGNPKMGMVWKNFTLATDRGRKEINVAGRFAILIAGAAE